MPKKIENLRDTILLDAKKILLSDGYHALTIRTIADNNHIAVGTVYNYFPSKDVLAAYVLLEEWQKTLVHIKKKCESSGCLSDAVKDVYEGVQHFARKYRSVWQGYRFDGKETASLRKRHELLVTQIAECLHPYTKRFSRKTPHFDEFLAENILNCVNGSHVTIQELIMIITRLEKAYE